MESAYRFQVIWMTKNSSNPLSVKRCFPEIYRANCGHDSDRRREKHAGEKKHVGEQNQGCEERGCGGAP